MVFTSKGLGLGKKDVSMLCAGRNAGAGRSSVVRRTACASTMSSLAKAASDDDDVHKIVTECI
jgi:hypothetical protein